MKIIKTALGWEIQPENDDEHYHLNWLIDHLRLQVNFQSVDTQLKLDPTCPQCKTRDGYNGLTCHWCGYGVATFTTYEPTK